MNGHVSAWIFLLERRRCKLLDRILAHHWRVLRGEKLEGRKEISGEIRDKNTQFCDKNKRKK